MEKADLIQSETTQNSQNTAEGLLGKDEIEEEEIPGFSERSDSEASVSDADAPEDKGNFIYWTFMLYGIGSLMPWNAVLNTFDYFAAEVRHPLSL